MALLTVASMNCPSHIPLVKADTPEPKRSDFPPDFIFGAGTSAMQTEGAYKTDGKTLSIWDTFTKAKNMASLDVADDSYHLYEADINLLVEMGVKTYRFSISWPRILPKGTLKGGKNQLGIDHYKEVIKKLLKAGIEPFVTIFHFDEPQILQDLYGGMLNRKFVDDFRDYCGVCFENFGEVKYWTLINEMLSISKFGYDWGISAPGRGSLWYGCSAGDSTYEPYIVTHNLLLAHAAGAKLYKDTYQTRNKGQVGISIIGNWLLPYSETYEHQLATERARVFTYGWFLDPLMNGDYPASMQDFVKNRLPVFTDDEKKMLKGSLDFIGINYYATNYIRSVPFTSEPPTSYSKDSYTETLLEDSRGAKIGLEDDERIFKKIYPDGLTQILIYLSKKYNNPKIFVTENGISKEGTTSSEEHNDEFRIKYMKEHIYAMKEALKEGVDVKGYFYWSLLDSWEFTDGYKTRYGLNFTNYENLERNQKMSAKWYGEFLKE